MADLVHARRAGAVVAGAAGYQAANRVADQDDLVDGLVPVRHQAFEQRGQLAPVLGDVATAVVAQVHRRVPELDLHPMSVGDVAAGAQLPGVVGLAQAVHEDGQARLGVRIGTSEVGAAEVEVAPVSPDGHAQGKGVAAPSEHVAKGAVQRADHEASGRRALDRGGIWRLCATGGSRAGADDRSGQFAGRRVGATGNPVVSDPHGTRGWPDPAPDPPGDPGVQLMDLPGRPGGRLAGQLAEGGNLLTPH